jgi:phosphoglycerate kinase
MAKELAVLADVYVNDAFSAAHRAHASTEGVARLLPAYAGRLMQAELEALEAVLGHPNRPLAAIIGGVKASTKLGLLENLVGRVDVVVFGGAMANTFLAAQGVAVGRSVQAVDMHGIARGILLRAKQAGCEVILPQDAVVAGELGSNAAVQTVPVHAIPAEAMILYLGPATVQALVRRASEWRTWSGMVLSALSRPHPSMRRLPPWLKLLRPKRKRDGSPVSPAAAKRLLPCSMLALPTDSATSHPPVAPFWNGWRGGPCQALPHSANDRAA